MNNYYLSKKNEVENLIGSVKNQLVIVGAKYKYHNDIVTDYYLYYRGSFLGVIINDLEKGFCTLLDAKSEYAKALIDNEPERKRIVKGILAFYLDNGVTQIKLCNDSYNFDRVQFEFLKLYLEDVEEKGCFFTMSIITRR